MAWVKIVSMCEDRAGQFPYDRATNRIRFTVFLCEWYYSFRVFFYQGCKECLYKQPLYIEAHHILLPSLKLCIIIIIPRYMLGSLTWEINCRVLRWSTSTIFSYAALKEVVHGMVCFCELQQAMNISGIICAQHSIIFNQSIILFRNKCSFYSWTDLQIAMLV